MSVLKFLLHLIRNNLVLKIFAVIFAVILWSYVIADTNPLRPKTLENIPVKIENMQELRNKGLTVSEDLASLLAKVSVQLEVRQKELKSVTADNVTVYLDLSKINRKGQVELKFNYTTKYGTILRVNPSSVELTVDDYMKKTVPVECRTTGTPNPDYFIGEPQVFPNAIEIAGARQDVEKAVSALCTVDLTGLTESINQSFNVTLLDQNRQALPAGAFFETLPSAIVKLEVLPKKTVVIDAQGSIVNEAKLKEGCEITKVTSEPNMLSIAGKRSVLAAVTGIFLENIDVSGASETMVFHVKPKSIEGIRFLNNTDVTVTVEIAQKQESRTVNIPLTYINKLPGLKAVFEPASVSLTIKGGAVDIGAVDLHDIKAYVDLKGLAKGVHTLPVIIGNNVKAVTVVSSVDKVKVTLK